MPTFTFTLTRDATESVSVEITAASIEEAHDMALENPPSDGWEIDDNAHDPYLPDPHDYFVEGDEPDIEKMTPAELRKHDEARADENEEIAANAVTLSDKNRDFLAKLLYRLNHDLDCDGDLIIGGIMDDPAVNDVTRLRDALTEILGDSEGVKAW